MEEDFKVIDNYLMVRMPEEVDHHKSVYISETADEYIMKEGVGNVVFDFESTRFMDSSGIGIIIGRYKKISYFGGKVFAVNADARIKRTLMICESGSLRMSTLVMKTFLAICLETINSFSFLKAVHK